MSQRVYFGLVHGEGLPNEYIIWQMAERFGWTLEYIDSLPVARWHELIQIDDGRSKAEQSLFRRRGDAWAKK